ncbi:ImmA/IrrE family metallo-endopeptidase [Deinococcus sp.]|uniref:ImmA/IrrE family metallo-endopeptidase n=1 Tax=Deinococcus sp. TaxID=47478 RepID=UPI0025BD9C8B|nr:ImmA/IrrE family metallo-endopeptidase [Deinococcus sp.]
MRELASAYSQRVPGLDAHSLILGLDGIELKYMPMGERDGAYDPEHHVILINSKVRPERQRFTLAHEISHALLLDDDDLLSDIHDAFEGERLEEVIESLCNVGAASLLMPQSLMNEMTQRFGYTGRTLAELARRADVSHSTALYALAEQTPQPTLYTVCAVSRQEQEEAAGALKALSVRVFGASPGVKYSIRPGTVIPDDHPIARALDTGFEMSEQSYVPFRSGRRMPAYVVAYPARGFAVTASFTFHDLKEENG